MPRVGELLVAQGLLSPEQVEQALRAQVVWGGRFGTNLIELGLIDLDALSRALAGQHGLPAALAHHFEHADRELQQRFDADLADKWSVVPLFKLGDGRVAIAGMDPITGDQGAAIAASLEVEPRQLVASIAAEQRMRYQLERVYGIARSARFLRKRGQSITPFPVVGEFEVESDSEMDLAIPIDVTEPIIEARRTPDRAASPPEALAALIDAAAAQAPSPDDEPEGRERRTYVKTLGDLVESKPGEVKALGRIAIRKATSGAIPVVEAPRSTATLSEALRAVRRGGNRERVAELAIDTLVRFAPLCDASAELVVPLDQPGLVPNVVGGNATLRGAAGELGSIDRLLLGALGQPEGELAVVPVAIAGRVMCVIAAAVKADAAVGIVESIAAAAAHAFGRLMREASR